MIASNRKPFYIIKKFGEGIKYHGIGIIKGNLGIGKTIEDFLGEHYKEHTWDVIFGDSLITSSVTYLLTRDPSTTSIYGVFGAIFGFWNGVVIAPYLHDKITKWKYEYST